MGGLKIEGPLYIMYHTLMYASCLCATRKADTCFLYMKTRTTCACALLCMLTAPCDIADGPN